MARIKINLLCKLGLAIAMLLVLSSLDVLGFNVLTYHNDTARTGQNLVDACCTQCVHLLR